MSLLLSSNFGSSLFKMCIRDRDIADVLNKEYKINIDKKKIDLKESIKTLGVTKVNVKLYEGVMGEIKIDVIPE